MAGGTANNFFCLFINIKIVYAQFFIFIVFAFARTARNRTDKFYALLGCELNIFITGIAGIYKQLIGNKIVGKQMRSPYGGGLRTERIGFVLTSDQWRQENKALALHAGPASVDWSLALRAANEENKAGHARYAQARTLGTHGAGDDQTWFDFPKVSFQFQAGNMMPIHGFQNEVDLPYGLEDFYNFFDLLNQPPLLASGGEDGSKEGAHNYVWIFYTSLQLPQVTLRGYFEPEGISWNDDADNPTMLNWNASFIVHEMSPNLWDLNELVNAYKEFMRDSVQFF